MARWKVEIAHYQQIADDMVTPGIYAVAPLGGFFLDTNNGAGIIDPDSDYANNWLTVPYAEIAGMEALEISYRLKSEFDQSNPDGSNYIFAVSDSIVFTAGAAYDFIKNWLIEDVTAPNNSIAVKITKVECEDIVLTSLNINVNQIKWDNKYCMISADLKEIQPRVSCFERTQIDDNWQSWFEEFTTHNHPRFKYCNKISPYLILLFMSVLNSIMFPLLLVESTINAMIILVNTLAGTSIQQFTWVADKIGQFLDIIVGCNYEHPGPLVRDYFDNVCGKCGITYDSTHDIFNSTTLAYDLNDGNDPVYGTDNPYYNTVLFYPLSNRKGMKTGKNGKRWNENYKPGFTGFSFAEELRKLFNAEWRIYNNEFAFYKKGEGDYINFNALVFDFAGADANLLVSDLFYFEWDEVARFAYMRGIYTTDALDSNDAEVNDRWNSYVDFNLNKNPNFKGEKNATSQIFAPTQFRFDNTGRDYILDGIIGTWGADYPVFMQAQIDAILNYQPIHAILLEKQLTANPRLIIWDPALSGNDDYTNSNSYSAFYEITGFGTDPTPNTTGYVPLPDAGGYVYPTPDAYYNYPITIPGPVTYPAQSYSYVHLPQYDVNYWPSYYVYSFPLHFDEFFNYNMYSNFYKQDDPQFIPPMRIKTTVTIKACCAAFDALGINGTGLIKLNCKCRVRRDQIGNYYDMWIYAIKYSAKTETIELQLHTDKYN